MFEGISNALGKIEGHFDNLKDELNPVKQFEQLKEHVSESFKEGEATTRSSDG